jgi:hypothetical protein
MYYKTGRLATLAASVWLWWGIPENAFASKDGTRGMLSSGGWYMDGWYTGGQRYCCYWADPRHYKCIVLNKPIDGSEECQVVEMRRSLG